MSTRCVQKIYLDIDLYCHGYLQMGSLVYFNSLLNLYPLFYGNNTTIDHF